MFIYGVNAVTEALQSGAAVESLQLATGLRDATRLELEQLARARGVPIQKVPRHDLDRLTQGAVHQGVVATWGLPQPLALEELLEREVPGRRMALFLDEIQDPGNLGALARSALAFGAQGIVLPAHRSAGLTPGAVKASAGALCRLPFCRVTNLGQAIVKAKDFGYWVVGADLDQGQEPWELDPGEKVALILGSEGSGIRQSIGRKLDFVVRIPMAPDAESLNVSVAGAILMYEWLARRP